MKKNNPKFVFVIVGNIGSGKTSVVQELLNRKSCMMPDMKYLALDDFREKAMNPNRQRAENDAKVALQKELFDSEQVIYEMTYSSFHSSNLKKWKAKGYIIFCTKLECSTVVCRQRAKDRSTALPLPYVRDVSQSIGVLGYKLQNYPAHLKISSEDNSPKEIADRILDKWLKFNALREQNGA